MIVFGGPATAKKYFGVQFLLEDELACWYIYASVIVPDSETLGRERFDG